MPGTAAGGLKAAAKNKANDPDFYRKIALKAQESWKKNGRVPRGFSVMTPEERSRAGSIGGRISRRRPRIVEEVIDEQV